MGTMMTDRAERITVAIEETDFGMHVLQEALMLASRYRRAQVYVLHCISSKELLDNMPPQHSIALGSAEDRAQEAFLDRADQVLKKVEKKVGGAVAEAVEFTMRRDIPEHAIEVFAEQLDADLIIMGSHGHRGMSRLFHHLTSEHVARHANCNLLLIHKKEPEVEVEFAKACPRCVEVRQQTGGKELFCAQHREKHGRRHSYHYVGRALG
ncbi:MAG: universal stress protein [Polyangiaceae bacterium]|nr:universal stress protein [Polyangiaceae bacterium]